MRSIRRNLILTLVGAVTLALLTVGYAIYATARDEAGEMLDYHLRQLALSLRDAAASGVWVPPPETDVEGFDYVIQIWDSRGVRLYFSNSHRELPGFVGGGFADVRTRDGDWRVFAIRSQRQIIQVSQPLRVRNRMALDAALGVLLPLLLLLPLLALAIGLLVTRGLAPLNRLARAVAERTPEALDPLPTAEIPREVQPLATALNGLLARLDAALAGQRAFIADAAHELRTPIAALQLQAQWVGRAESRAERQAALAELDAGIRRASRAVQQLLTLARLDPDSAGRPHQTVKLADLARAIVTELSPLAQARSLDLGIDTADDSATVAGDPDALAVLLRNLVENALRYTPDGGTVDVSLGRGWLEVSDTGPGIPAAERTRVFDRFYRGAATLEAGTGLGLAIVKAIADRHGATVALSDRAGGGLRVRVAFPGQASGTPAAGPGVSRSS